MKPIRFEGSLLADHLSCKGLAPSGAGVSVKIATGGGRRLLTLRIKMEHLLNIHTNARRTIPVGRRSFGVGVVSRMRRTPRQPRYQPRDPGGYSANKPSCVGKIASNTPPGGWGLGMFMSPDAVSQWVGRCKAQPVHSFFRNGGSERISFRQQSREGADLLYVWGKG